MPKNRRREFGIEAFVDEDNMGVELTDEDDISEKEMEKLMAKESAKAKARRAEAEAEEDEVEDEDESEPDEEDEEEVEDEDEEDDDEETSGFIPWILHDEADWELTDAFEAVDKGDPVIIYDMKNNVWYKLQPINVGELPAAAPAE